MVSLLLTATLLALGPEPSPAPTPEPTPAPEAAPESVEPVVVEAAPAPAPAEAPPAPAPVEPTPPAPVEPTPPAPPGGTVVVVQAQAGPFAKRERKPKPSPEERLAKVDEARLELHFGIAGYGRFLGDEAAYGGGAKLGMGVRLVRGLYLVGEIGGGVHAMPVGVAAQVFVGARHELRVGKWVRPTFSLGYTHLVDATFDAHFDAECGCFAWDDPPRPGHHPDVTIDSSGDVELAQRNGIQAGLGARFPMRWAPRLSVYVQGDVAYYFDDRPGRLQVGIGGGLQVVF